MRKRRLCLASFVARRPALALLLAGPALLSADNASAADKAPVLHVAEQTPDLGSVEKNVNALEEQAAHRSSRRAARNQPATAELTSAIGGWIAREAIGKQVPLRDPATTPLDVAADQPVPADDSRPEQKPVADESAQDEAAESPDEAGDDTAAPGPISLKSLNPVPLMEDSSQSSGPQKGSPTGSSAESNASALEGDPERDGELRADSDHPAETVEEPERNAAMPEATQVEKRADRPERRTALPVRRPKIELEEAGERGESETALSAHPPASDSEEASEVQPSQQQAPVLSASVARLKRPIERCLRYYYRRPENAAGRSAWGMMHAVMVYGVETQVIAGRKRYNTIAWLAGNNICRGKRLLTVDRQGIVPRQGVGLQGHQGQLLAILGLVGVPADYPLYVNRQKFTVEDLIAHEQRECRRGEELTFTLIALAHYIDTDSKWRSKDGEQWDFERLLQEELAQPIIGTACGGTHRLMGLSHALRIRKEEGHPITGQWARAETFVQDFTDYAWKLQNRDGSMSTDWFEGRADNGDLDRKIQTTGHIVEWMLCHTPDDRLGEERLVRAIRFLTAAMSKNPSRKKEIGPKGHALRALAVYHRRAFDAPSPWDVNGASSGSRASFPRRSSNR